MEKEKNAHAEPEVQDATGENELQFEDQSSRMPLRKILVVYLGIGLALMVAFMDQTAVSTATPVIANDLNASATISWVGTAFFVGNCAFQLVYGRISDIFGRKITLQIAVALLVLGDLLCSIAQTPIQLYAFRALGGIGGGGITNIAMVIVSDIVPLKERGKYQGFISAACSLGNAIGPFVGGGFASSGQWRWLFRVISFTGVLAAVIIHIIVPLKPVHGSVMAKVRMIDFAGILLSSAGTVFLLIPISGGGSTFEWDGPISLGLLISGGLCLVGFVLVEKYVAKLPILPLRLFKMWTPTIVMIVSFLIGMIYYGNIYYVPISMQYVHGYSALVTGALVLAFTLPQSAWGIAAGFFVSKTNHYKLVINVGALIWTLGLGLQLLWTPSSSMGMIVGILEVGAIGIGFNLQTTLVAALATTKNEDRAVVTGGRNYFRTMGAGFGLAVANAIYQHDLSSRLKAMNSLSEEQRDNLLSSALESLSSLSTNDQKLIRQAYSESLKQVFICFTAIAGAFFLVGLLIKELKFREDTPELQAEMAANKLEKTGGEVDVMLTSTNLHHSEMKDDAK